MAASLHLATAIENSSIMEFDCMENPLRSELLTEPLVPGAGLMRVPDGPGLGVSHDPSALKRYQHDGEDDLAAKQKTLGSKRV